MPKKIHEQRQHTKPSLLMRLAAGLWFALLFGALALGYFAYVLGTRWSFGTVLGSTTGLYRIIAPAAVAGVGGSLFGTAILAGSGPGPTLRASFRGMAIGFVFITSYVGFWALEETLYGARHEFIQFVWLVIYITIFWGWIAAVPLVAYGGVAGFLLHYTRQMLKRIL